MIVDSLALKVLEGVSRTVEHVCDSHIFQQSLRNKGSAVMLCADFTLVKFGPMCQI